MFKAWVVASRPYLSKVVGGYTKAMFKSPQAYYVFATKSEATQHREALRLELGLKKGERNPYFVFSVRIEFDSHEADTFEKTLKEYMDGVRRRAA